MTKKILLTNDDGYDSKGLFALKDALKDQAQIFIVAPANEKSACGHGLTLTKPLSLVEIEENFYKLDDGTPSDCIYLALNTLYKKMRPDLVISGINLGSNMGEDITYSGTVAGAMEGVIQGIPSIAISQVMNKDFGKDFDFALAKKTIVEVVAKIFENGYPLGERKLLNINIPYISTQECRGFRTTQKGYRLYGKEVQHGCNPRGREYHWLGLHPLAWNERQEPQNLESDFLSVKQGYVSITPIKLDMTSYEDVGLLDLWLQ